MNKKPIYPTEGAFLYRHLNGIKIIGPNDLRTERSDGLHGQPLISMDELMSLPFNVFFLDLDHYSLILNDNTWQSIGLNSSEDAIGERAEKFCSDKKQVIGIYANDSQVIKHRKLIICDEQSELQSLNIINALSIKMPWYGESNNLMGVFGCAIIFNELKPDNIASQLSLISNTFLSKILPPMNILPGKSIDGVYFSIREIEIIRLIIRGRTMRESAGILCLSARTVENYFSTIKSKMNVKSKSEFIDKVIDYFV